jgi:hypothetical protein
MGRALRMGKTTEFDPVLLGRAGHQMILSMRRRPRICRLTPMLLSLLSSDSHSPHQSVLVRPCTLAAARLRPRWKIIMSIICLTTCHSVHASCQARWMNGWGPPNEVVQCVRVPLKATRFPWQGRAQHSSRIPSPSMFSGLSGATLARSRKDVKMLHVFIL